MLSQEHRALIAATVPLLEQNGEALTRHFYLKLFKDYPEVMPLFNQAHQHSGDQQRALANSILMYARNIERLEQLGPLVGTIVNKHVALQILPEHYPMVGASLLKAIREVLGAEVATDAVIDAWAAAYGQLADILMRTEGDIYQQNKTAPGGWEGARKFVVSHKTGESDEIMSFQMKPADGRPVLAFEPGQCISLRVTIDGVEMKRQYSLSAESNGYSYQISVKREPLGQVSNFLHDHINVGDAMDLFPPSGTFTLAEGAKPVVLISGGVGITPTLSMLTSALKTGREVYFIHAARHGGVHAFRRMVDQLAERHDNLHRYYCYAESRHGDVKPDAVGLIDATHLRQWLPETRDVDAYFLGPVPFMKAMKSLLREARVPEAQTFHEFFGPAPALA